MSYGWHRIHNWSEYKECEAINGIANHFPTRLRTTGKGMSELWKEPGTRDDWVERGFTKLDRTTDLALFMSAVIICKRPTQDQTNQHSILKQKGAHEELLIFGLLGDRESIFLTS